MLTHFLKRRFWRVAFFSLSALTLFVISSDRQRLKRGARDWVIACAQRVKAEVWLLQGEPPDVRPHYTIDKRLEMHGAEARNTLRPLFKRAGVAYPPRRLTFVGLKRERRLLIYAAGEDGVMRYITAHKILGASGHLGPKLREGDRQVPEGLYKIDFLNPNSSNHLSMRIDYPNALDRAQGAKDKRARLGGEIYIHGKSTSAGCLAMGDRAIEPIWVLAADTGIHNIEVIMSPLDFRARSLPRRASRRRPAWVKQRHERIADALKALPPPRHTSRRLKE